MYSYFFYKISSTRRQDFVACLTLVVLFAIMLSATWQRWIHPIMDHGREMNLPARILAGEQLYTDIRSHYGPLAPYLNAELYRIFGIKMMTLHSSGIASAALIIAMVYWLARRLMNPIEATITSAYVMLFCAFNTSLGNYVQPYAYAALYGYVFALISFVCVIGYLDDHREWRLSLAGICGGMALICKPELVFQSVVPVSVAISLSRFSERRLLRRAILLFALPVIFISATSYGILFLHVPWFEIVLENYQLLSTPQMAYFSRFMNGTSDWPLTGWALLEAFGPALLIIGLIAMVACVAARSPRLFFYFSAWRLWVVIFIGLILTYVSSYHNQAISIHPLRTAPLVFVVIIGFISWRWFSNRNDCNPLSKLVKVLFLFTIFASISIFRVFLNISLHNGYTPFTTPILFVIYFYLLFNVSFSWILPNSAWRDWARQSAIAVSIILFFMLALQHISLSNIRRSFEVCAERGCFFTVPEFGIPMVEAIQFVQERTDPLEQVAVLPQGTLINFLTNRSYPMREEIIIPGFVTGEREQELINGLNENPTPIVILINFPTADYFDRGFGIDYNQKLMRWVTDRYHLEDRFSIHESKDLKFGDRKFFIDAYVRNP